MLDLNIIWFVLIGVLFAVFFLLEGFDYGVGMISFLYRKEPQKQAKILGSIAPFWEGNEVWMITAAGALFAAFPVVYAVMFSGLYIPLVLLLLCLIGRVFAFEVYHQNHSAKHRKWAGVAIFIGSIVPAFLWGVVMYSLLGGSPISELNGGLYFTKPWYDILSIPTVLAGFTTCSAFLLYGAIYLKLKDNLTNDAQLKSIFKKAINYTSIFTVVFVLNVFDTINIELNTFQSSIFAIWALLFGTTLILAVKKPSKIVFYMMATSVFLAVVVLFSFMFPNLMISNIATEYNLTIRNAANSQYTLKIMAMAAIILVPIIITYQTLIHRFFTKDDNEITY